MQNENSLENSSIAHSKLLGFLFFKEKKNPKQKFQKEKSSISKKKSPRFSY